MDAGAGGGGAGAGAAGAEGVEDQEGDAVYGGTSWWGEFWALGWCGVMVVWCGVCWDGRNDEEMELKEWRSRRAMPFLGGRGGVSNLVGERGWGADRVWRGGLRK